MIWTKYLQYALQRMYEVANEIDEDKDAVKEDLAVAEAKLASTDTELAAAHEEVSRVRQLLQQQATDLNTRTEQIKTSHIDALKEADERSRNLERAKAESDRDHSPKQATCNTRVVQHSDTRGCVHQSERMMIPAIVWNQLIPHLNVVDKGASITRDEVSKQVCGVLRALRWQW